jgi:hypothetical protein
VHWLEVGAGGRWIARIAVALGIAVLSLLVGYKQFRGPLTETTLAQAAVGRQLAHGQGFTTPVNYPQTAAWLRARASEVTPVRDDALAQPFPELHQPPLYSLAIAATLRLFPEKMRAALFASAPAATEGFRADYVLLALNVALLWLAAAQTFFLARRLFGDAVAWIAMGGLLLSTASWSAAVAVNGTPLAMVLFLALFQTLARLGETGVSEKNTLTESRATTAATAKSRWVWLAAAGALSGLLFLTDYAAGVGLLALLAWAWRRFFGTTRALSLVVIGGSFLVVSGPWMARNVALAGNPLALAWQTIALRTGDPTAEPAAVRATLSAEAPTLELNKIGNKGLTSLQRTLGEKLWAGGGIFFTAFFVAGFVYRFRDEDVDRLRRLFVATLALLVLAQAFFDSAEGERTPIVYATPLIAIFGAGFFAVLIASSEKWSTHLRWAAALLLAAQGLPLVRDVVEPRRQHFNYPPYWPGLFVGMSAEMARPGGAQAAWMADVPAGAAWYSGQRVWARPATLRDFYGICLLAPQAALVLTPQTLERPFFGELTKRVEAGGRFGEWADVHAALVTNRFPAGFPLTVPQKITDNLYVLVDPLALNGR